MTNKKEKRYKKKVNKDILRRALLHRGSQAQTVLMWIEKLSDIGIIALDEMIDIMINPRRRYLSGRRNTPPLHRVRGQLGKVRATTKSLVKRGYIEIKKGGMVALTKKANLEVVRENIMAKQHNNQWDGKWRLIFFDIAESKRGQRDFLRNRLKEWKFIELQRSVWVAPYDVEEDIYKFIELTNIYLRGDIRFAVVENLTKDNDLIAKFNL